MQAGKPMILQDVAYTGILQMPGGRTLKIKGMNRVRIADELVVYNSFTLLRLKPIILAEK